MLTKGAIAWGVKEPYAIEEIDIGEPKFGEVRVRLVGSGLCHSDLHIADGERVLHRPAGTIGGRFALRPS